MVRTGKKYVGVLPAKLILLLVLIAVVFLLGYTTAAQAADKDAQGLDKFKNNTFLDPFTLTLISYFDMTSSSSEGDPLNPRALMMMPHRRCKRSPHKPPWPPHKW